MRLRTTFIAGLAAVGIPGILASGWIAQSAWAGWRHAVAAADETRIISDLQRTETALNLEIGLLNVALLTPQSAPPGQAAARSRTDAYLGAARRNIAAPEHTELSEMADRFAAMRAEVAAMAAKPLADRDRELQPRLMALRDANMARLDKLIESSVRRMAADRPQSIAPIEVATRIMAMRLSAGTRNLILQGWVSGAQPVTAQSLATADRLSGAMAQDFAAAGRMISDQPALDVLRPALANQDSSFAAGNEPHWRRLIEVARQRLAAPAAAPPWPETLDELRQWSVPAQADILLLRDAALDAALSQSSGAAAEARLRLVLSLASLVASLGLAAIAVIELLRRIVRPVQALTGAVQRIAAGCLDAAVPGQGRTDELGEMAASVAVLRDAAAERAALAAAQVEESRAKAKRAARIEALAGRFETQAAVALQDVTAAASRLDGTAMLMSEAAGESTTRAVSVAGASHLASQSVQTGIPPVTTT